MIPPCGFDDPVPSPDGRLLMYRTESRLPFAGDRVWVANADGSAPHRLTPAKADDRAWGWTWSPDSARLAYIEGDAHYLAPDAVHVVRPDGTGDRLLWTARSQEYVHGISWSPNGKSLALLTTAGLFLRHSDGRVVTLSPSQFRGSTLAWSPDGRWIAVHDLWGQYDVSLVRIGGGTTVIKRGAIGLAWSPDSRLLALEASNGLNVRDMHSGRTRLLTRDTAYQERPSFPNAHSLGLAWPPDGRSVAYIPGGAIQSGSSGAIRSGDLRTVTLTGHVRMLVSADRSFGGRIVSVAWTQPPSTVHRTTQRSGPAPGPPAAFAPEVSADDEGRCFVSVELGSDEHVLEVLDAVRRVMDSSADGAQRDSLVIEMDEREFTIRPE